jgi:hypothetical protein
MPMVASHETIIEQAPHKFAMNEPSKLVTFIKGEPPTGVGKGRRKNPIVTQIYSELLTHRNQWAHVNIPITNQKQLQSLRIAFYTRAKKDNLNIATSSVYNEKTKTFDLWVMLTN